MKIWVDADACPKIIKELLYRAAMRLNIPLILVSNQVLDAPKADIISKIQVMPGLDGADARIVKEMAAGDLIITADIPLANEVVEKGGVALNPRGEIYTSNNIKQRLALRNFNMDIRSAGVKISGPAKLSKKEVQTFATNLNNILLKAINMK